MNGAGLGIVEHTHAENEWQRRSDPQLEQRPEQRQASNHLGHQTDGRTRADVLGNQFFGGQLLVMHGANLHLSKRKRQNPQAAAYGFA